MAIDGSQTADLALTESVRLAKTHDATLRIAHVIDATDTGVDPDFVSLGQVRNTRVKAGRELLTEAAAFAKKAGLRVETRLLEIETPDQRIVDVLVEETMAWPADLVVIGTHGRRGLSCPLLGSVVDELVRIAPKPVLLIGEVHLE